FFNAHNNFLEEVAKFRAARRLWAELVRERYQPRNERSCWLRFHTQTGGSTLTAQQPENNVARVAIQALAAVCGGTQSLHTNGADEALGLPTETSARVALRSQQIVAHETGVADVADPLGGSWAIEALTEELAAKARSMIEQIEELGGAAQAIEQGYQQNEIANAAYRHQLAVESRDEVIVGVNAYTQEEDEEATFLAVDPAAESRQIERVRKVREQRDARAAIAALDRLRQAAAGEDNLVPRILDCVRQRATLGEISDRLRAVWGEYER
ncbi:MAG: methylmalonyl-CoA mutase family protein, partial [Acidobacteriota bacterium]|nr:methylmalonyl-CoA mutase family protein [Acidobacteriota bacterium]